MGKARASRPPPPSYATEIQSKVGTKKPTKYIVNFRYISEVSIYRKYIYISTKCTLSWNKKRLQNKSEIFDL